MTAAACQVVARHAAVWTEIEWDELYLSLVNWGYWIDKLGCLFTFFYLFLFFSIGFKKDNSVAN